MVFYWLKRPQKAEMASQTAFTLSKASPITLTALELNTMEKGLQGVPSLALLWIICLVFLDIRR
jgi:hypothetical protein